MELLGCRRVVGVACRSRRRRCVEFARSSSRCCSSVLLFSLSLSLSMLLKRKRLVFQDGKGREKEGRS